MTKTYKLTNIHDAVKIGTTLTLSWFRGHSQVYNELTPRIFRSNYTNMVVKKFRPNIEFEMVEQFKLRAPAFSSKIPPQEDHVTWLFLMQHHGMPTRLLDWTENVLVALYFAVFERPNEDGELWSIYPDQLNKLNGFFGLPLPNNRVLRYLAAEPMLNKPKDFLKELNLKTIPKYPLAVKPPFHFERIIVQSSTFTIHPKPCKNETIPEILSDEKHLVQYVIPKENKSELLSNLSSLGITKSSLFPNLDSLSHDLIQKNLMIAYSPPPPPKFDDK